MWYLYAQIFQTIQISKHLYMNVFISARILQSFLQIFLTLLFTRKRPLTRQNMTFYPISLCSTCSAALLLCNGARCQPQECISKSDAIAVGSFAESILLTCWAASVITLNVCW